MLYLSYAPRRKRSRVRVPPLFIAIFLCGCGNFEAVDAGASAAGDSGAESVPDAGLDAGAAVDTGSPWWKQEWRIPARDWPDCETSYGTPQSLAEKAAFYQWISPRLHRVEGDIPDGRHIVHALFHHTYVDAPPPTTIVPDEQLPHVVRFESFGNAGLWTSHYVAAQAFRYATARREGYQAEMEDALKEVKITVEAIYNLLRITNVEGLYARGYWSPLPIFEPPAPQEDVHLVTAGEFRDYTWVGDVSQDEYSGHMFALGIVAKLVEDPGVQGISRDVASQVGHHLVDHNMAITDVDGEPTKYGRIFANSLTDPPGYNAWLALTWIKLAAVISGERALDDFYHDCLLQEHGRKKCIDQPMEEPQNYTEYLSNMGVQTGCSTNHDDVSMTFLAAANLIWFEERNDLRQIFQRTMREQLMFGDPDGQDTAKQQNPFFNMIYAAFMDYGDPEAPPPESLIKDALCTMKEFPADKIHCGVDNTTYPEFCVSKRHGSITKEPVPWREQRRDFFIWWESPYERSKEDGDPLLVEPPADYLLPYWMGRYFGWITAEM